MITKFLLQLIEWGKDQEVWTIEGVVGVESVTGQKQESEIFGHEYVDQKGPGMSGDDYRGYAYLPIPDSLNLYAKIYFAC